MEYLPSQEACKKIGVSDQTLRAWARKGKIDFIRTGGNQRRYNVDAFMKEARRAAEEEKQRSELGI
jgi:excisionase family DNA binding protein